MIVLETSVISEVFRSKPDPQVAASLESLTGDVAITTITLAELLVGVRRMPDGCRKLALMTGITTTIQSYRDTSAILGFDDAAAEHCADIVVARERSGIPIALADAQIAAICRSRRASCATRKTKDFAETGIELLNPWIL